MVSSIFPLALNGATVERRHIRLLGPITRTFEATAFTIVLGPNGAGKTTLLRLMHGLERPRAGTVDWAVDAAQARSAQAFVFQTPIILRRTVRENIAFPLLLHRHPRDDAYAAAEAWIDRVDLGHAADLNAQLLSGGEKQKLAIARSLVQKPELLFLDEPTTNLDGRATREIETILMSAVTDGLRVIMTTHDLGQARRLADEILFLYQGCVHECADKETFFTAQSTAEARAFVNGEIVE